MGRFILIFIALFILELIVLIQIGSVIGALQCIGLMFLSMVIGACLVKMRAKTLMTQMQETHHINIRLLWLPLAGFLFIFPGFISDVLAILVLIPQVENFLVRRFAGSVTVNSNHFSFRRDTSGPQRGQTIDGEFTRVDEEEEIRFTVIDHRPDDADRKGKD